MATTIGAKLILLAITLALAVHARLRLVPRLEEGALKPLAFHIVAITIVAVLMVVAGVGFRTGGIFVL
jgi:putative copper export protein